MSAAGYTLSGRNPDGGSMLTLTPIAATKVKELLAAHRTVTRRVAARIVWGRPVPA